MAARAAKKPKYGPHNKYALLPEHREQLRPWADRWVQNALNCDPMGDADREAMREAVNGMYAAADLPLPKHIVFVPSPLVAALAGSFAAGIWYVSRHGLPGGRVATDAATDAATYAATRAATDAATRVATYAATDAATDAATYDATRAATRAATYDATYNATYAATDAATRVATYAATRAATRAATYDATYNATYDATRAATDAATDAATRVATYAATDEYARFLLSCCPSHYRMWNGGNQWSGWCAYLSFFRHVAHFGLPEYDKWRHYEAAAIHGGPRVMHADFCIVSDRPKYIHMDDQHRPHCETGPFCEWRDGWKLWYLHGVPVTEQIVMRPETLTVEQIRGEENLEVRRCMIERFGHDRFMREIGAKVVQEDDYGRLLRAELPEEDLVMVHVVNGTAEADGSRHEFFLGVPPTTRTALEGVAWTYGMEPREYADRLAVRT